MEYNTKYSKEFKLDCVLKYLNGEYVETPPNTKRHTFTLEKCHRPKPPNESCLNLLKIIMSCLEAFASPRITQML